jgi:hypothetical protein
MNTDTKTSIRHNDPGRSSSYFFSLWVMLLFFAGVADLPAAAPLRPGQQYAEASLCARSDVFFCEDFNYPENFSYYQQYGNAFSSWTNPAFVGGITSIQVPNQARQINPATSYPAKPQGTMPSGSQIDAVWVGNWDPTKGVTGHATTWGLLRNAGGKYANGMAAVSDVYVRFQVYWTSNYAWPGDPKTDKYNYGAASPIDNKILFLYPPEGINDPTGAAYDAGLLTGSGTYDPNSNARFADALILRVGDASAGAGYEGFPMCYACTYNPNHMEYAPFQSLTLRNPHDQPLPGRIFRFDTNRWYTVELRYKLSSVARPKDGTIEVWIDGTKIYSASDMATCGYGSGDCSGLGAIDIVAYHNSLDQTAWNGQQVIDNLVISQSYIGPPPGSDGVGDMTPPDAPRNLRTR